MKETINLKGYRIRLAKAGEKGAMTLSDLKFKEDLCQKMCDVEDNGERYSQDSRYIYTTKYCKGHKGICFGIAIAAVQKTIINQLGYKKGDKIMIL